MSGKWDDKEREMDGGDDDSKGWTPKHHDPQPPDQDNNKKIYSVTEASRLHAGKNIRVKGVISGIQPLRKMTKGVSCQCMKCNTHYEIKYAKPELFQSYVPIERIRKCPTPTCKTGDFLGAFIPDPINAVIVELKDHDTFSEIDPLRIIVFGDDEPAFDNTRNIERHIGETVIVTGDIYNVDIGRNRDSKVVAYLYVKYLVKYLSKQELELTVEDVKAIKRFVDHVGPDKTIDKLVEMFANSIIGYNYVKEGLLLCAASTTTDKLAKKIHAILVGDPGLAKSQLLKKAIGLVPNSRYESVQFATGKSLTAIVTKEEGDALILRIGPIPQAKGAIAALNEIGRMSHDDQGYMLDTMQEQCFTTNKFGRNFHVDAPTAIIASANPTGGSWKAYDDDEKIDSDKIPMIKPLIDRFDLIFIFKDNRNEDILTEYAFKKSEMEDKRIPDYTAYLTKHIMYAKQRYPKPKFSDEAKSMLNHYYVKIRVNYGSPRIRETIYRIAENITRLKLKNIVDAQDATDTMKFYNVILQQLDMIVALPTNPKDVAYEVCLSILRENKWPVKFEEVVKTACERNQQVRHYIGHSYQLSQNHKLRSVRKMLENHSRINIVHNMPLVFEYIHTQTQKEEENKVKNDENDENDAPLETPEKIIS